MEKGKIQKELASRGVELTEAQLEAVGGMFAAIAVSMATAFAKMAEATERASAAAEASAASMASISAALAEKGDAKKLEREKKRSRKSGELMALEDKFLEEWNAFAKSNGLSEAVVLTSRDRSNFAARMTELNRAKGSDEAAFEALVAIMNKISEQPFALGRVKGKKWKIDVHQFLTSSKFSNVESGTYGEKIGAHTESDGSVRDDSLF